MRRFTSPAPRSLLLGCAALALVVAGAAGLSSGEYIWTDVREISERALILETPRELWNALWFGVRGQYYRPTILLFHTLTYWAFGDHALAFRAGNFVIHVGNAVLVYLLGREARLTDSKAAAAAILFAVHPVAATHRVDPLAVCAYS